MIAVTLDSPVKPLEIPKGLVWQPFTQTEPVVSAELLPLGEIVVAPQDRDRFTRARDRVLRTKHAYRSLVHTSRSSGVESHVRGLVHNSTVQDYEFGDVKSRKATVRLPRDPLGNYGLSSVEVGDRVLVSPPSGGPEENLRITEILSVNAPEWWIVECVA